MLIDVGLVVMNLSSKSAPRLLYPRDSTLPMLVNAPLLYIFRWLANSTQQHFAIIFMTKRPPVNDVSDY